MPATFAPQPPQGGKPAIMQPPQDLKNIIDKTAQFVARLGKEFESRIQINEQSNPKFSFLKQADSFHPYYKAKVREMMIEQGITPPPEQHEERREKEEPKQKEVVLTEAQKLLQSVLKAQTEPKAPEKEEFITYLPADISPIDLDVMKLTAQFVARNGQPFLFGLIKREARNPQFEFLNPGHHHFPFYNSLVDAYTKCLLPNTKSMAEQLRTKFGNKQELLQTLKARAEWEKREVETKRKAEEEAQKEREAMAAIDWHDFVVVETIEFYEDEELPPPLTHQQLLEINKKPLFEQRLMQDAIETNDEMEMETAEPMEPASPPPPPPPKDEIDDSENIKIVKDYDFSRARAAQQNRNMKVQICPKCGQEVPVDEMEEHMKIELLDPRARAQRQQLLDRNKASILASDDEISRNLGQFAKRRTDIFGEKEVGIGKTIGEDEDHRPEKVIWDGHAASIPHTTQAALGLAMQPTPVTGRPGGDKPLIGAELPAGRSINPAPSVAPPVPVAPMQMMPMMQPMQPMQPMRPMVPPMMMMPQIPGMHMYPPMMMGQPMMQAMDMSHMIPDDDEDHPGKKAKGENANLIPEQDWLAQNPGPVQLKVQLPTSDEKPEWRLNGSIVDITVAPTDTIATLKERLGEQLGGMPANKQKLKTAESGFFKDTCSLAYYNIGTGSTVYLSVKTRGRGRK